jgi:hypothetical protein
MPSRRHALALAGAVLAAPSLAGCNALSADSSGASVPAVDGRDCPPMDLTTEETVCSHTDADGGVDLSVSRTEFATDAVGDLQVTIANHTDGPLTYDPDRWRLYRTTGSGWSTRHAPASDESNAERVPVGESVAWSAGGMGLGLGDGVEAGLYGAVLTVGLDGDFTGSERSAGVPVDCVFLFRVTEA